MKNVLTKNGNLNNVNKSRTNRLFNVLFAFALVFCFIVGFVGTNFKSDNYLASGSLSFKSEKLYAEQKNVSIDEIVSAVNKSEFLDRTAGSIGEKRMAENIIALMQGYASNFKLKNNKMETFSFQNATNLKKQKSQNLIFRKDNPKSKQQVVLTAPYDNFYGLNSTNGKIEVEGFNISTVNVSNLIYIASCFNDIDFDCDIEIVFLGAENYGFCGSKYYFSGFNKQVVENTLLVLNISDLSFNDNLSLFAGNCKNKAASTVLKMGNLDKGNVEIYNDKLNVVSSKTNDFLEYSFSVNEKTSNMEAFDFPYMAIVALNQSLDFSEPKITVYNDSFANVSAFHQNRYKTNIENCKNFLLNLFLNDNFAGLMVGAKSGALDNFFLSPLFVVILTMVILAVTYFVCRQIFDKELRELQMALTDEKYMSVIKRISTRIREMKSNKKIKETEQKNDAENESGLESEKAFKNEDKTDCRAKGSLEKESQEVDDANIDKNSDNDTKNGECEDQKNKKDLKSTIKKSGVEKQSNKK